MDDFKEFASTIVELIVNYIYDNSYLDELDLLVKSEGVEVIDDLQFIGYKCRIYNTLEKHDNIMWVKHDNIMWVTIRCTAGKYAVHISSPYLSTFGLTILLANFSIATPDEFGVTNLDVTYTAQLNEGLGLTVDSNGVYGTLEGKKEDNSFQSFLRSSGLVTVSRVFDFNLLLDLYKDMLYKSAYCLGRRK